MKHKIILSIFVFLICVASLQARAPVDQILQPPVKSKGMRVLRNKNITYTNEQPEEKNGAGAIRTIYEVKGRSRPDRSGKVLSQIEKDSEVTPFKWSRDKKWIAVIVRTSGVRVWVPKSALPTLGKNLKLEKAAAVKSSEEE
jgi:hypothetical protein